MATCSGQPSVRVYADKAGASYNVGLADFTIPGFQGDLDLNNYRKIRPELAGSRGFCGKTSKSKRHRSSGSIYES